MISSNSIMRHCLITDLSSNEYHSIGGTFSSSQLKVAYEDPEKFKKKYIDKTLIEDVPQSSFDVGTYFHTSILEPHLISKEIAVYKGIRRGKEWDAFKAANAGKTIITENEMEVAEGLVKAVKESSIAMGRIERGDPEVSTFVDVHVTGSEIYNEFGQKLDKYGWITAKEAIPKNAIKMTLKARADLLGDDFILDLKSTTGNVKSEHEMRQKISYYKYELSAALYLDLFSVSTKKVMSEFIWTFASKDNFISKSYMASPSNILVGRAKWRKAVLDLADGIRCGWEFQDSMGYLEPNSYELEILKPKNEELI